MKHIVLFSIAAILRFAAPALAGEPETFPFDPVALIRGEEAMGRSDFEVIRGNYRYLFVDEANRTEFLKDPERCEIQMGGGCGRMGALSGAGSVNLHAVHEGRIYIFASSACRTGFLKSPELAIDRDELPPATTPETLAEGRKLLELMLNGAGGTDRVDSVTAFVEEWDRIQVSNGQRSRVGSRHTFAAPASFSKRESWDDSWWASVAVDSDGWTLADDGSSRVLNDMQCRVLRRDWRRGVLGILQARNKTGFVAVAAGQETISDSTLHLLTVHVEGATTTLGIDPRTGRVMLARYRDRGPSLRLGDIEILYSDFREVAGLTLPLGAAITCDGQPWLERSGTLTRVSVNETIDPATFTRPTG